MSVRMWRLSASMKRG